MAKNETNDILNKIKMRSEKKTDLIQIRITPTLNKKIKQFCINNKIKIPTLVVFIIENFLDNQEY